MRKRHSGISSIRQPDKVGHTGLNSTDIVTNAGLSKRCFALVYRSSRRQHRGPWRNSLKLSRAAKESLPAIEDFSSRIQILWTATPSVLWTVGGLAQIIRVRK